MGGGKTPDVKALTSVFGAMRKYIETCDENEFIAFSLVYLIEHQSVSMALSHRMESIKTKKDNE